MVHRSLVVNADDFGQSPGINRGVIEAFERGIVTSASLMVRHQGAADAAAYARDRSLAVGLHVDLGEWMCQDTEWIALYEVVTLEDAAAVSDEVDRQLERFRMLVGHDPTHLDSHQHVHLRPAVREVLMGVAERLGVPLRGVTPWVRYCGHFYGQTAEGVAVPALITTDALLGLLRALRHGLTELGCHPGHADDLVTMYRAERSQEIATLCDPVVRNAIAELGITLRSFKGIRDAITSTA